MTLFKFTMSLRMLRAAFAGAAILCGGLLALGIVLGHPSPGIVAADGFLVGFNVASALFIKYMIHAKDRFNEMHALFDAMVDMNQQLLANKVRFIMEGREEEAPIQPRLH